MASIDYTGLSFDEIRQNLVEYYKQTNEFKDVDFAGSAIGSLIDSLAYCVKYLTTYANFSLSECFLDSASVRSSVTSIAKTLGYFPYQETASKAQVLVKYNGNATALNENAVDIDGSSYIPAGTVFMGNNGKKSFYFIADENSYFTQYDDGYFYATVNLIQGTYLTEQFTQDEFLSTRCELSNSCDISRMSVTIKPYSNSTNETPYTRVDNITDFSRDSEIYYLQEGINGKVEVFFGDDKLSKAFNAGNVCTVTYLQTAGAEANGIASFSLTDLISVNGYTYSPINFTITTMLNSHGGADRESIESIKFNAPKYFQRQDRNVTISDYNAAIINKYGGLIKSITSWGGEDNNPPQYGKVFVSILSNENELLSDSVKQEIIDAISSHNLPCITTEIVNPEVVNVNVELTVNYYSTKTSLSESVLIQLIRDKIEQFFEMNLAGFKARYKESKVLSDVLSINSAIDDVIISKSLHQYIEAYSNEEMSYRVLFNNEINPGSVYIGSWEKAGGSGSTYIYDKDGLLYQHDPDAPTLTSSIGTVNYETGEINIITYDFQINTNMEIKVEVVPKYNNIDFSAQYLMKLGDIVINMNNISYDSF